MNEHQKKTRIITVVAAICLILLGILLYTISVYSYRFDQMADIDTYYNKSELAMLLSRGSRQDRMDAQEVLDLAEAAFEDISHTREENREAYGMLARYATTADRGAVSSSHSLELWSAQLGENRGYLWVFYTSECYDAEGNTERGSWNIPSLWTVEKDGSGTWTVVDIKEHP